VDLDVSSGGSISWKQLSDRVAVTWQNVPDYGKTDSNSFQVEMFFDGRIRITLLGIVGTPTSNSDGSIIGLSNGGGQPTGFVSSNFSAYPAPPAIVTGVAAMSGNSTVALIWNAVNGATSYNVKRSLTSGSGYTTIAGGVTATSYSDTGLSNGTTYYYVVSAVNAAVGEGADSAQASATPLAPPAAPTGLVASGSNGFVSLAWNTVINAASYTVKRSVTSGSGYTAVGSAVATTSYTDNSVSNGTTYYYVITAANTSGTSAASAEASARPSAPITVAERSAPSITLSSNGSGGENATTTVKSSVPGHTYQLQHTTDLVNGTWQNVGASKVGDGSDLQLVAPVNSTDARGFFRILIQQ
jgi:fibronectin type 3 domain-containing protein